MPNAARPTFATGLLLVGFLFLVPSAASVRAAEHGALVIMGGGVRYDQPAIWTRIVRLAGGERPSIAVFPTASSEPLANGSRSVEALCAAGADAFLVPLYLEKGEIDHKQLVVDRDLVERVRSARRHLFHRRIAGAHHRDLGIASGSTHSDVGRDLGRLQSRRRDCRH